MVKVNEVLTLLFMEGNEVLTSCLWKRFIYLVDEFIVCDNNIKICTLEHRLTRKKI